MRVKIFSKVWQTGNVSVAVYIYNVQYTSPTGATFGDNSVGILVLVAVVEGGGEGRGRGRQVQYSERLSSRETCQN